MGGNKQSDLVCVSVVQNFQNERGSRGGKLIFVSCRSQKKVVTSVGWNVPRHLLQLPNESDQSLCRSLGLSYLVTCLLFETQVTPQPLHLPLIRPQTMHCFVFPIRSSSREVNNLMQVRRASVFFLLPSGFIIPCLWSV